MDLDAPDTDLDLTEREALFEEARIDSGSMTLLLVAGGSRDDVLRLLGVEDDSSAEPFPADEAWSAYAATEVAGGVVAFEHTGYADPHPRVLAALSELGGAAAVTRSDIEAHDRFGCARDGRLLFDADEFIFVGRDEKARVPEELRALFDTAWIDLEADGDHDEHDHTAAAEAGFAMAALHTGLEITSEDLSRAVAQGYHRVRRLTYRD